MFSLLLVLWGCTDPIVGVTGNDAVVFKKPGATPVTTRSFVSVEIQAVDGDGAAIPCDEGELDVEATITLPDGTVRQLGDDVRQLVCGPAQSPDVALVLDNSGSQEDVLEATRQGAQALTNDVLDAGGRVALVRASTFSEALLPLTSDAAAARAAIDGLFVNRGWTALWDAVRIGNETLAAGQLASQEQPASLEDFCAARRAASIVVLSNGVDNNSAEERLAGEGDGIATTFEDAAGLTIAGVPTPIDTIGLGRDLSDQTLADLSIATGGTHLSLAGTGWITDAFDLASTWDDATWRMCAEVETTTCGDATLEVTYELKRKCNQGLGNGAEGCDPGNSDNQNPSNDETDSPGRGGGDPQSPGADTTVTVASGTRTIEVHLPCGDGDQPGRAATVMFPLATPDVPQATAGQLVRDVVAWAAGRAGSLDVAVYQDDRSDDADALLVAQILRDAGHTVTIARELDGGLRPDDVAGFDVVWFSAPGRPIDDWATEDMLRWHVGTGHGVVLQGEDLGRALGGGFEPASLTGLAFDDPGVASCGVRADAGGRYRITFDGAGTPLPALADATFTVDADVDHTHALGVGEQVVAWATVEGATGCQVRVPAVTLLAR